MQTRMRSRRNGFTLVELTVVLTLVALVAAMAMPMIVRVLEANAYSQAYYAMSAMLRAARTTALIEDTYVGMHHQKIDHTVPGSEKLEDRFFMAVVNQSFGGMAVNFKEMLEADAGLPASEKLISHGGSGLGWDLDSLAVDRYGPQIDNCHVSEDGMSAGWDYWPWLEMKLTANMIVHSLGTEDYTLHLRWGSFESDSLEKDLVAAMKVTVFHTPRRVREPDFTEVIVDQTLMVNGWSRLGTFPFRAPFNHGDYKIRLELEGNFGTAVLGNVFIEPTKGYTTFVKSMGQGVQQVPGTLAFGELKEMGGGALPIYSFSHNMPTGGTFDLGIYDAGSWSDTNQHEDFTSFTVLFSPYGSVSAKSKDNAIVFASNSILMSGPDRLWDGRVANRLGDGEFGTKMITLFDYAKFKQNRGDQNGIDYLNRNARMLVVNVHTGEIMRGEDQR